MSVRVNLLPEEASVQQAAARERLRYLVVGGVLVIALAGVSLWQSGRASDADATLAQEETLLASLTAEQAQLVEFVDLERRVAETEAHVVAALGTEVSLAAILQDLASVMPSDAQLETLSVAVDGVAPEPLAPVAPPEPTETDPADADADVEPDGTDDEPPAVAPEVAVAAPGTAGTLTAVGSSLNAHAPGLERLLLELDKVVAFRDIFFSSSVLEDPEQPYATFTVESELGPEVRTGRYLGGVPEELR